MIANEHAIVSKCLPSIPSNSNSYLFLQLPTTLLDMHSCVFAEPNHTPAFEPFPHYRKEPPQTCRWRAVARFGHVPYVGQLHSSSPLASLEVGGRSSRAQQHTQSISVCCGEICGLSGSKNRRRYTDILAPCTQGREDLSTFYSVLSRRFGQLGF